MKVNQGNLHSLLAVVTPRIIQQLAEERSMSPADAAAALYGSRLYTALEREETKAWHLSAMALTDLLEQELDTGSIAWSEVPL